jgi:hypothetical protein
LQLADEQGRVLGTWNSAADYHGPASASLPQLVAHAWQRAYLRLPTSDELAAGCALVQEQQAALRSAALQSSSAAGDHELTALTSLCQQLLSSSEFLYVD